MKMSTKHKSENGTFKRNIPPLLALFFIVILLNKTVHALPVPHGIDGIIYELDGVTQVRSGIDFSIYDTANQQGVYGKTGHGSPGRYSASLQGEDGDILIIRTWNKYNQYNISLPLHGVMRNVNLILNMTYPPAPPIINSGPVVETFEDSEYSYEVIAFDENDDTIEYSLPQSPPGMSIDSFTGRIRWTPANKDVGFHEVIVQASDGMFITNQSFRIEVLNVNDAPELISIPVLSATQDMPYAYDADATDEDSSMLHYSLMINPKGMSINETSGLIMWIPSNSNVGLNNVRLLVSDGNLSDVQDFIINVSNVNDLPFIGSMPVTNARQGELYTYDVNAYDIDNDVLNYSLTNYPDGMEIDKNSGIIKWIPKNSDVGIQTVTVKVSDSAGFAEQSFALRVENVNDAPVIVSKPITDATVDKNYLYDVNAYDPDGDILSYKLLTHPKGMKINSSSGVIQWNTKKKNPGNNSIVIEVSDGNLTAVQEFILHVIKKKRLSAGLQFGNFTLRVSELAGRPDEVERFSRKVYKYLKIDNDIADSEEGGNFTINFSVEKDWLDDNEIRYGSIVLTRYSDMGWEDLSTKNVSSDKRYVHYAAKTGGFSYFAISVKEGVAVKNIINAKVSAIKVPFRMSGIIYNSGTVQVPKGTEYVFENKNNSETFAGETGMGPFGGMYSLLINGHEGDLISVKIGPDKREFFAGLSDNDELNFSLGNGILKNATLGIFILLALAISLIIFIKSEFRK